MQPVQEPVQVGSQGVVTSGTSSVVRNAYMFLGMCLGVAAFAALAALSFGAPVLSWWLMLGVMIGGPFLINSVRNSMAAIPITMVWCGLLGFFMGPIVGIYLSMPGGSSIVFNALAGTALIFFSLSAYAWTSKRDFSFLGGFAIVGCLVVLLAIVANIFLQIPALSLTISAAAVILMSALILWDTSRMIHGGETNYVMITVGLFANIYVLFSHLLNLFSFLQGDD